MAARGADAAVIKHEARRDSYALKIVRPETVIRWHRAGTGVTSLLWASAIPTPPPATIYPVVHFNQVPSDGAEHIGVRVALILGLPRP